MMKGNKYIQKLTQELLDFHYLISITDTSRGLVYWDGDNLKVYDDDIQNNRIPDEVEGLFQYPEGIPNTNCMF